MSYFVRRKPTEFPVMIEYPTGNIPANFKAGQFERSSQVQYALSLQGIITGPPTWDSRAKCWKAKFIREEKSAA